MPLIVVESYNCRYFKNVKIKSHTFLNTQPYLYFNVYLQYLGEVFDPRKCKSSGAPCDNCRKGKQEIRDITNFAVDICQMVSALAMKAKFFEKNFTVNHLVDILRGSKNKRILSAGWDRHPGYKVCTFFYKKKAVIFD